MHSRPSEDTSVHVQNALLSAYSERIECYYLMVVNLFIVLTR